MQERIKAIIKELKVLEQTNPHNEILDIFSAGQLGKLLIHPCLIARNLDKLKGVKPELFLWSAWGQRTKCIFYTFNHELAIYKTNGEYVLYYSVEHPDNYGKTLGSKNGIIEVADPKMVLEILHKVYSLTRKGE